MHASELQWLQKTLLVGCGGFFGACARYWAGAIVTHRFGDSFPYHTILINVTGSFLLGLLAGCIVHFEWHPRIYLLLGAGFLGAYTTFSTFELENYLLAVNHQRYAAAIVNTAISVVAGFIAVAMGYGSSRLLTLGR